MEVVSIGDVEAHEAVGSYFEGKVHIRSIIGERADEFRVIVVHFGAGATSVFHTHTADHVLYITEGTGVVATESEETTATPGTVVHIPAGEKHMHGAAQDSPATLIAVMPPGETSF